MARSKEVQNGGAVVPSSTNDFTGEEIGVRKRNLHGQITLQYVQQLRSTLEDVMWLDENGGIDTALAQTFKTMVQNSMRRDLPGHGAREDEPVLEDFISKVNAETLADTLNRLEAAGVEVPVQRREAA